MREWRYGVISLLCLLLAACTSDADPSPTPTVTTRASSTPATTSATPKPTTPAVATTGPNVRSGEKPPKLPALGKTNTRPGATTFAAYWFRALDWGYATTDAVLARGLYDETCATCAALVTIIDRAKSRGEHFAGGRLAVKQSRIVLNDHRHPGSVVVDIYFNSGAVKTIGAGGVVVDRGSALNDLRWREWLRWAPDDTWRLIDLKRVLVK